MKKGTHRIILAALCALSLLSCTPTVYNMAVQVRQPSSSGLDLVGKTISIVSMKPLSDSDTLFSRTVAQTMAVVLEKEYFASKEAVALYEMPSVEGASYGSRDSLVSILMQTGSDVLLLQDSPRIVVDEAGKMLYQSNVYVYDSMDKEDKVRMYHYSDVLNDEVEKVASRFAANVAQRLTPVWQTSRIPFYFYEDSSQWEKALDHCDNGDWGKAIKVWMPMTSTGTALSRACASYDIAAACYALGDCQLALQWLDASSQLAELEDAPQLRRKIVNKLANHK